MTDLPSIGSLRLLGDGRGALLLTTTAEAAWWCAPRFDSSPTWWSLLDSGGPAARFDDVECIDASVEPAGATAWTRLRSASGDIDVRDGLVDGRLVRIVRGLGPELRVCHRVSFRAFDDAAPTRWTETELRAGHNEPVALSVSTDAIERIPPAAAESLLASADRAFARAAAVEVGGPDYAQRRVRDALAVMHALRHEPTGGVVAAVTTSLPEATGADRNFDYRYTWLRDGALAASVAALHGRLDLASSYLRFVEDLGDRICTAPLFTVDGGAVPRETTLDHVAGWAGSRPVRLGNAAADQIQFDALAFVVEAVSTYAAEGGPVGAALWRMVRMMADRCCDDEPRLSNGIWEFREKAELVSADIGRWIALERALRVARRRPLPSRLLARRSRWKQACAETAAKVLGALLADGRLPQRYGGDPDTMDASALLIVMFGMLDHDDPRARQLVDAHLEALGDGPFLRRYPASVPDEFQGVDATFTPCSWWAVTALHAVGRHDEAVERFEAICRRLPRLLSEEFDPRGDVSLGNTPLLWSHAEAARTMKVLFEN